MTVATLRSRFFSHSVFTRGLNEFRPRRFDAGRLISQMLCQLEPDYKAGYSIPDEVVIVSDTATPDPMLVKLPSGYAAARVCSELTTLITCLNEQPQANERYYIVLGSSFPLSLNRMSKRAAHSYHMANIMAKVIPETIEFSQGDWLQSMRQVEQTILFMEKPGRFFFSDTLHRTERQWTGSFCLNTNVHTLEPKSYPQLKSGFVAAAMRLNKDRNHRFVEHNLWLHSQDKSFANLSALLAISLQNFCAAQNIVLKPFQDIWLCCPDFNLTGLLVSSLRKGQLKADSGRNFAPSFFFGWHPLADFVLFIEHRTPQSMFIYFDGRHNIKIVLSQETST